MTATLLKKVETDSTISPTVEVLTNQKKESVKIKGKLTSQIRTRASTSTPYYAFLRLEDCINCHNIKEICQSLTARHRNCQECAEQKCKRCEIPVIFRLAEEQKPNLDKSDEVILAGIWAKSDHSPRQSFTVYSYQLLANKKKNEENISRYEQ